MEFLEDYIIIIIRLGIDVVISEKTTKDTIKKGMQYSNDEMCISLKAYLGHVVSLQGKCDYVLLPRIENYGLNNQTCTNYLSTYDIITNLLEIPALHYNISLTKNKTEEKEFLKWSSILKKSKKEIKEAYHLACLDAMKIKKALEGSIVYSNITPIITLQPSSKVSNEDVFVGLNWYVPYIKKAYVDVELDGIKDRHPFNEEICLKAVENKDLFYKVFAYARDAFGNEVSDMVIVRIDKRAPSTSLYLNNEQVLDKKIIKKLPEFEFLIDDNRANMRIEYYINGVLMDMDIEKVFNRMIKDDVLKVKTYTYDALSNFEIKEYEFMFSPDKKIEMVSKSEQILRSDEVATFERIWSVNEKNELVLEKNTKVLTSKLKPKIHYVRKKNKVQIFSKDQIESCFVNGKKIAIQKDVLGHD